MKTLADNFNSISPQMLDAWFATMMKKYHNSQLEQHLKSVYTELTGESVIDNSLVTYYNKSKER